MPSIPLAFNSVPAMGVFLVASEEAVSGCRWAGVVLCSYLYAARRTAVIEADFLLVSMIRL